MSRKQIDSLFFVMLKKIGIPIAAFIERVDGLWG
jgi:hypothetical protein